eukprot:1158174-Pelagomonas_calceolata.AAC.11
MGDFFVPRSRQTRTKVVSLPVGMSESTNSSTAFVIWQTILLYAPEVRRRKDALSNTSQLSPFPPYAQLRLGRDKG